jgi:hypothetical protein
MANFNFAIDGQVDMMSLNPLEMTNFEMTGFVFAVAGVIFTILKSRAKAKRQLPHKFVATETEEGAIE